MISDIGKYIALGKVLEVYPNTYTATVEIINSDKFEFGRYVECKITTFKFSSIGAASVSLPTPQDVVYISFQHSATHPSIVGYQQPSSVEPANSEFQHKLTPLRNIGGEDKVFEGGTNFTRGRAPSDLLPGDQIFSGDVGQTIGILKGGSIIAKASHLCQILLTKAKSSATIVARRLKIYTDFGEITSESENGTASLRIRGNSSVQKSNRAPGSYGINIRLGGKNLLDISLERRVTLAISNSGDAQAKLNSLQLEITADKNEHVTGSSETTLIGSRVENIGTDKDTTVKGKLSTKIRGSEVHSVVGSQSVTVGGASRNTYQSVKTDSIKGVSLVATDPVAYHMNIGAGDCIFEVGSPSLGGLPAPILLPTMGSFKVLITAGDFVAQTLMGNVSLTTLLGNVEMSSILGTAKISSPLKASVESEALTELKGGLVALEAEVRMLSGASGSVDPVVTAMKLTKELLTKVILVFNTHTHPPIPTQLGPQPVMPPPSTMSPIQPLDIVNEKSTLS